MDLLSLWFWTLEPHLVDLILISLLILHIELLDELFLLFLHREDVRSRDLLIGIIFRERGRYPLILVLEQFLIDWIQRSIVLDWRFHWYLDVPDLTIGLSQGICVINILIQTTHVTIHGFVVHRLSAVGSTIHANIYGFPTSIVQLRNAVHIILINLLCSIVRAFPHSLD